MVSPSFCNPESIMLVVHDMLLFFGLCTGHPGGRQSG